MTKPQHTEDFEMPSVPDVEVSVLGAMLLEPETTYLAVNMLKPDSFHTIAHRIIYQAMTELVAEGKPVDLLTVTHKLREKGELKEVGGTIFISQLTNKISSTANLDTWMGILEQYAIKRRTILLCLGTITDARDDLKDIFDVCEAHGNGYVELGHVDPDKLSLSLSKRADAGLKRLTEAKLSGIKPGIYTGLDAIDRPSGGFQTGLYVIAARPGCGKSELAAFITHQVAAQGIPVYFCQCEMSEEQSINREFSKHSGIPYSRLEKANVTHEELDTIAGLVDMFKENNTPVHMDHVPGITINKLISKIKFQSRRNKIRMVVIDYLQIMDIITPKGGTRDQAIGIVTRRLKQIANELKISVILLAQLSRSTDHRRPFPIPEQMDLRESGNIENDADAILFLYYAHKYRHLYTAGFVDENGTPLDKILMLIWDKNRFGMPGVREYCRWESGRLSFKNMQSDAVVQYEIPHPDAFIQPSKKEDKPF